MISFLIWLFNYIPSFLVYSLLFISIVAYFFNSFLPIDAVTKNYIKIASVGIFIFSLYASGMIAVIDDYKLQLKDWEHKIALAEEKSNTANENIKYVYKDRVIKIRENTKKLEDTIKKQQEIIDKECKLNSEAIKMHNRLIGNTK